MADNKKVNALYNESALAAELKGEVRGAFVFLGDEDYAKESYISKIREKVITEEWLSPFNHFIISFSSVSNITHEAQLSRLADAIDAVPMGGARKLIEIRDLCVTQQNMKIVEALIELLKGAKDSEDTVTVALFREDEYPIDYKAENSALFKKIAAAAKTVKFDAYTPERLAVWEKKHFSSVGLEISGEAALTLADMCACRMFTINSEFMKLAAYAESVGKKNIDADDVRLVCAVSEKDEMPFALSNAAEKWNIKEVLAAVYALRDLKKEPVAILARFASLFSEMLMAKTAKEAGKSAEELAGAIGTKSVKKAARLLGIVENVPLSKIESCIDEAYRADVKLKSSASDPWVTLETFIAAVYTPRSLLC